MKRITIYDNDLHKLLVNDEPIISGYKYFIQYIGDESLGEWWDNNEQTAPIFNKVIKCMSDDEFNKMYNSLFSLWIDELVTTEKGKKYIQEEIYAYNFKILNN